MKCYLKNVLFVAPETKTWDGKTYYQVKVVDDLDTFDQLDMRVEMEDLAKLPQPRTRVDVQFDMVIRDKKKYLQNPVFSVLKQA
ncbi:hypothetical protein [Brevibacillus formosus]|uniref:hypothetical protein n=1 Tax=Brevibacillus formosus TaxID=54913 RepID=UPI003F1C47A8